MTELHDLFVIDGLIEYAGGHIGDEGQAEDLEAHVTGDEDLVDGGHADQVGAEGAEGSDLGGGFVRRAEDGEVDAFGEGNSLLGGLFLSQIAEGFRVGTAHVEEALAGSGDEREARLVGAEGGVGSGEVDVVREDNEASLGVGCVDPPGGVGDDEGLAAEETEDACREGDLRHGVTFIGVDAALHDGYGDACDRSEDEFAGVSGDGGLGETGDVGVGDRRGVLNLGGEVAEAGAENDAEDRGDRGLGVDVGGCGFRSGEEIGHGELFPCFSLELRFCGFGFG